MKNKYMLLLFVLGIFYSDNAKNMWEKQDFMVLQDKKVGSWRPNFGNQILSLNEDCSFDCVKKSFSQIGNGGLVNQSKVLFCPIEREDAELLSFPKKLVAFLKSEYENWKRIMVDHKQSIAEWIKNSYIPVLNHLKENRSLYASLQLI